MPDVSEFHTAGSAEINITFKLDCNWSGLDSISITQLYQWEKKPRKTTEEMDGQCK